jgi:hypothetical protein
VAKVRLMVLKLGADDPLDRIVGALRRRAEIDLTPGRPIGLDTLESALIEHPDIDVLLILGPDGKAQQASERVRDIQSNLHVVSVALETGRTSLTLQDPNLDALTEMIVALGRADRATAGFGKILSIRSRLAGRAAPAPASRVPAIIEAGVVPDNIAILADALGWVEQATRILLEVWSGRKDEVPGLSTTWEALERWLAAFAGLESSPAGPSESAFAALERRLAGDEGRATPLGAVAATLGDDRFALKLFLISVAGELDMRFHRLFGALHDDFSRRRPSLGLACAIIAASTPGATPLQVRGELAVFERLRRLGLVCPASPESPAAEEPLGGSRELIDWLLTGDGAQLARDAGEALGHGPDESAVALVPAERVRRLRRLVRHSLVRHENSVVAAVLLGGSEEGWLPAEAAAIETAPLLAGPPDAAAPREAIEGALARLALSANLTHRRLVLDLTGGAQAQWPLVAAMLDRFKQPPLIAVDNPAELLVAEAQAPLVVVHFPAPTTQDRRQTVAALLAAHGENDPALPDRLLERFPVSPEAMPRTAALALASAVGNGRALNPDAEDWFAGFRQAAGARLPLLARRIEPEPLSGDGDEDEAGLGKLILPPTQREQIAELVRHVRFGARVMDEWGYAALLDGKGVAALFSGESGTGKTTAAHAVASDLRADLYAIDLSQVVSKYIGETEKNLEIVFAEAQSAGAVLLFDEADALFGKRSAVTSAHDRYANIEVAYLLQRLQRFTGLAILTTNNPANIDQAFARRLRFRIEFPRPAPAERLLIWEQSLPERLRGDSNLELKRLAVALDVTGGTIRQMAFHAAVLALEHARKIAFEEVIAGARSQLVRLGQFDDIAKLDAIAASHERKAA